MEKIFRMIKSCLHRHHTAGKLLSVLVVAASLAGSAVIAYADTTSTVRPGSNKLVTAKPTGNDCYVYPEGFYFYVQPYESARTVGNIAAESSGKTNPDGRTLKELLNDEFYANYRFSYQFEALTNLRQSPAAIKYVPKAVVDKFAIEENWMQKKTYFYETKGAAKQNDEMKFHAGSAVPNVKDKKFGMPVYGNGGMKKTDFEALAKTGVFYESLEDLVKTGDGKYKYENIAEKLKDDPDYFKKLAKKSGKQKQARQVWEYLLDVSVSGGSYTMSIDERVNEFLTEGYNNNRPTIGGKKTGKLKGGTGLEAGDAQEVFGKTGEKGEQDNPGYWAAMNEYNLHYLDLMLCAYAFAYGEDSDSYATEAWGKQCKAYAESAAEGVTDNSKVHTIYVGVGSINMGYTTLSEANNKNQKLVYSSSFDLIDAAYGLAHASETETSKAEVAGSVAKPYAGAVIGRISGDPESKNKFVYWNKKNEYNPEVKSARTDIMNEEEGKKVFSFIFKGSGELVKDNAYTFPESYDSYYSRLKNAIRNTTYTTPGEGTPTANSWLWCGSPAIQRVLSKTYSKDAGKNVTAVSEKKSTNAEADIEMLYNASYPANGMYSSYVDSKGNVERIGKKYGGGFIPGYFFVKEDVNSDTVPVVAYLDLQSELTNKQYTTMEWTYKKKDGTKDEIKKQTISTKPASYTAMIEPGKDSVTVYDDLTYRLRLQPLEEKPDSKDNNSERDKWYNSLKTADKSSIKISVTYKNADGSDLRKSDSALFGGARDTSLVGFNDDAVASDKIVTKDSNSKKTGYLWGENALHEVKDTKFKTAGIEVKDGETKTVKVYAVVRITWKEGRNGAEPGKEHKAEATSNMVCVKYKAGPGGDEDDSEPTGYYSSHQPKAYAELKEGTAVGTPIPTDSQSFTETFEAMAGVPSTRSLYFSSGGTEFMLGMAVKFSKDQEAVRKYDSHFNGTECEYKETDQLKGLAAGGSKTETFVADANGADAESSVTAEKNNAVNPSGASGYNTTTGSHDSNSVFTATWTGTIGNSTGEPADIGAFDPGKPGSPCAGKGFDKGTQRKKAEPDTNWDVGAYNTALSQAVAWAKSMEATNAGGTVVRVADSDGVTRKYHVGDAVITVALSGGSNGHAHTTQRSYSGGTYSSAGAPSGAKLNSSDKKLGNGWGWTDGTFGSGSGFVNGSHGHGGACPGHGPNGSCTPHNCGSFTPGVDITQAASASISYTITVTFKNGYTTAEGGAADAAPYISRKTVGTLLPAHALCGPCHQHDLPELHDTWTQKLKFETLAVTNLRVWKIDCGYGTGMSEIRDGNGYEGSVTENDTVISEIVQSDPNLFYNIAAANTSEAGRIRYSLQTGQDDDVYWEEMGKGTTLTRTKKCDGKQAAKLPGTNPCVDGRNGHQDSWSKGCLYSNTSFANDEDHHRKTAGEKKAYSDREVDSHDKKTLEWKRFDMRRNLEVTATVISDFLILQTSSGDQSALYYQDMVTAKAQQNFDEQKLQWENNEVGFSKMWENNPLSMAFTKEVINTGSYNGQYSTPFVKYKGTGTGKNIPTAFDDDEQKYNHIEDEKHLAKVEAKHTAAYSISRNCSTPGISKSNDSYQHNIRPKRVRGLVLTETGINQNPVNVNKEYKTGQSYLFYRRILTYDAADSQYGEEIYPAEDTVNEDLAGKRAVANGYTVNSIYTEGKTKVNNIVVHDPVSVEKAYVVPQDQELDQRVIMDFEDEDGETVETDDGCPGTAAECIYRIADCQYGSILVKAAIRMDDYEKYAYDDLLDEDGNPVRDLTENDYDYTIYNRTYESNHSYALQGTEFKIREESSSTSNNGDGEEKTVYLKGSGKSEGLLVEWSTIAQDTDSSAQTMRISARVRRTDSTTENVLFCGDYFTLTVLPDGRLKYCTDGADYVSRSAVLPADTWKYIDLEFSFGSPDTFNLYVYGGTDITGGFKGEYVEMERTAQRDAEPRRNYAGTGFYIGNSDKTGYSCCVDYDTVQVYRMPGGHAHIRSCYTTVRRHALTTQDTFNGLTAASKVTEKEDVKETSYEKAFAYTGGVQKVTLDPGTYKIEAWGAAGSTYSGNTGGNGGYAYGTITLKKQTTLYMAVGGRSGSTAGGYNGGGYAASYGGGGGATSVATADGTLASLSQNRAAVLMVAGGGGGGSHTGTGGAGGGANQPGTAGNGGIAAGAAASGYAFGQGASSTGHGGAGGSGWYGGWAGTFCETAGGGGSGYADTARFTQTGGAQGVNSGNGRVKITGTAKTVTKSVKVGTIDWTRKNAGDSYVITAENNRHVHTCDCITKSTGLITGVQHAIEGDDTDLVKMLGSRELADRVMEHVTYPSKGDLVSGESETFDYTGGVQTVKLAPGTYTLETWGAQGGVDSMSTGGRGGYAKGTYTIAEETVLYIAVGGQGTSSAGGYNGGGNDASYGTAGGGATHIATVDGVLKDLSTQKQSVLIVAGGGGGGAGRSERSGGAGGGETGVDGYNGCGSKGCGGTQTTAGISGRNGTAAGFGYGGSQTAGSGNGGAGGGGGWYGGGAGGNDYSNFTDNDDSSGGGGSGYTGGVKNGTMSAGVRTGNGMAKITAVSITGTNDSAEADYGAMITLLRENMSRIPEKVTTDGKTIINPVWGCGGIYDSHECLPGCRDEFTLNCTEAHHAPAYVFSYNTFGNMKLSAADGVTFIRKRDGSMKFTTSGKGSFTLDEDILYTKGLFGNYDQLRMFTSKLPGKSETLQLRMYYSKDGHFSETQSVKAEITDGYMVTFDLRGAPGFTAENMAYIRFDMNAAGSTGENTWEISDIMLVDSKASTEGGHYGYDSGICYQPCYNDAAHAAAKKDLGTDENGKPRVAGDFILLDNYFQVYFPNYGDFEDTDDWGIPDTEQFRGKGYIHHMHTLEWTRSKWICFPYAVLYNRNGTWEQHEAGEWFILEIYDRNRKELEYYDFYCLLKNDEMADAAIQYSVEAVNLPVSPGGKDDPYLQDEQRDSDCVEDGTFPTNKQRFSDLTAYHSAYKTSIIDVVGRIGNMLIDDTEDMRFSNLFKMPDTDGWQIDGIVRTVNSSVQNCYLSWHRNSGGPALDVRGVQVSEDNRWYNTYADAELWTEKAGSLAIPVSGDKNTVSILRDEQLKLGYGVLWDITSIGNYTNGRLQVQPYYYILDTQEDSLIPVDVYIRTGDDDMKPVNYFGIYTEKDMAEKNNETGRVAELDELIKNTYEYTQTLDWEDEKARRNFGDAYGDESAFTKHYLETTVVPVLDSEGNPVYTKRQVPVIGENGEITSYLTMDVPLTVSDSELYGNGNRLGSLQLVNAPARVSRTLAGSSKVTALHEDINGDCQTELTDPEGTKFIYEANAQRWHQMLRVPSSAVFVAYRDWEHVTPETVITYPDGTQGYAGNEFKNAEDGRYVLLETAKIYVLGDVWDLCYSTGKDNGVFVAANGKRYEFNNYEIPTLIAIYDAGISSSVDIDTMQTH